MTRKEAIANLSMISVAFVEPVTKEQRTLIDDTFDMAIQALEQEPCEDYNIRKVIKEQMIKYGFHAPDMTVTEFVESLPRYNSIKTELKPCDDCISRHAVLAAQ